MSLPCFPCSLFCSGCCPGTLQPGSGIMRNFWSSAHRYVKSFVSIPGGCATARSTATIPVPPAIASFAYLRDAARFRSPVRIVTINLKQNRKKVSEGTVFLPFGYFSFYCFTFSSGHYPLTAPTIIPFTKYFCRKGYSSRIGTVATMIFAYLMDSDSIGESLPSVVADTSFIIRT